MAKPSKEIIISEDHVKQMAVAYQYYFGNTTLSEATASVLGEKKEAKKDDEKKDDKKDKAKADKKNAMHDEELPLEDEEEFAGDEEADEDDGDLDDEEDCDVEVKVDDVNFKKNDKKKDDKKSDKKKDEKKAVKESKFSIHVLCGKCGSHDQTLSKHKTMIKCDDCGNKDLLENIVGMK